MIQKETFLKVLDNSGYGIVKCFCIYGGSFVKNAFVGDIILVSVQTIITRNVLMTKIKKCVVTSQKKWKRRDNGHYIRSDLNSVIVLNDNNLEGNKIDGPIFSEVFFNGNVKISTLTRYLI